MPTNSFTNNSIKFDSTSIGEVSGKLDILPVGFVYWQLPGQKAPGEFLAGNWVDITSQYAGLFFRAAGGDGLSFSEDSINIQKEGLPNITGSFSFVGGENGRVWGGGSGVFKAISVQQQNYLLYRSNGGTQTLVKQWDFAASNSNSIYGESNHVTPINTSIRIWVRQED